MAAFARSGAEISLKETLPVFIPGFDQKIDYYFNECDFADEEEKKYFNKYSNIFVFGFYLEKRTSDKRTFGKDEVSVDRKRQVLEP